jgi:hypothetical protein
MDFQLICEMCKKPFPRPARVHNQSKKRCYENTFCSNKCQGIFSNKTIQLNCKACGKEIIKKQSEISKSKTGNSFCNSSCAASYNNTLHRVGRRSKIEIKFYEMLIQHYPQLEILNNDKTMLNGLEVDIAIPELKLAIEWNGIIHFKPIYGQQSLDKINAKDQEKLEIASNKDINLIVICDKKSTNEILEEKFLEVVSIIDGLLQIQ